MVKTAENSFFHGVYIQILRPCGNQRVLICILPDCLARRGWSAPPSNLPLMKLKTIFLMTGFGTHRNTSLDVLYLIINKQGAKIKIRSGYLSCRIHTVRIVLCASWQQIKLYSWNFKTDQNRRQSHGNCSVYIKYMNNQHMLYTVFLF